MNIMYNNRQFLQVHWIDEETPLAERLTISNQKRNFPYKLWFLDCRTERKYRPSDKKTSSKGVWSFYMPNESCPLDYRELSVWFVLWSKAQQQKVKEYDLFTQSLSGLEKLVGLGKRQGYLISKKLKEKKLLVFDTDGRQTWFGLNPDIEKYASWFKPINEKPQHLFEDMKSWSNIAVIEKVLTIEPRKTLWEHFVEANKLPIYHGAKQLKKDELCPCGCIQNSHMTKGYSESPNFEKTEDQEKVLDFLNKKMLEYNWKILAKVEKWFCPVCERLKPDYEKNIKYYYKVLTPDKDYYIDDSFSLAS